ncbi:MAG: hypothetical protein C4334_13190 [Pyrinomonas sp.]
MAAGRCPRLYVILPPLAIPPALERSRFMTRDPSARVSSTKGDRRVTPHSAARRDSRWPW